MISIGQWSMSLTAPNIFLSSEVYFSGYSTDNRINKLSRELKLFDNVTLHWLAENSRRQSVSRMMCRAPLASVVLSPSLQDIL